MKKLKFNLLGLLVLFVTASAFIACNSDEDVTIGINEKEFKAKTVIGSEIFIANVDGSSEKYEEGVKKYDFIIDGGIQYEIQLLKTINFKGEEVEKTRIINTKNNEEFIDVEELEQVGDDSILLTITTSTGDVYEEVLVQSNQRLNPGVPGWFLLVGPILDAIVEINTTSHNDVCSLAIQACGENGVKAIHITEGSWFSSATCSVICN